jgi:type IV pilus assembly protein PilB
MTKRTVVPEESPTQDIGEDLIKQDLITREEFEEAQENEARSGTPWYRQFIRTGKVPFAVLDQMLRYQFHPRSKRAEHETLGQRLLESGELSKDDLTKALQIQRRTGRLLGMILLEEGYVAPNTLGRALGRQYNMEFADLASTSSAPEALEAVPESLACDNEMLPVMLEGDRITVLVTSPQGVRRIRDIGVMLGKRIHTVLTACENLESEITARYAAQRGETALSAPTTKKVRNRPSVKIQIERPENAAPQPEEPIMTNTPEPARDKDRMIFEDIAKQAAGTSVVKTVNTIIEGAINAGATDIHLDPQEPEMRVRYRIDGVLHDVMSIPEAMEAAVVSRIKIISELDITETRHPQDGHISLEAGEREFDIRVATLPTFLGERVVLRLLDQTSVLQGIRDLGMEPEDQTTFLRLIDQPYGMILVTGPTGSGKTTSLYAALNQKNVLTDSIVTLEDPVEYQLSGINQVQIDPDIDLTFANVLRASLRQDIDVLLVGEIRDTETARIAVRAAMTGHLVFSTLHTNDAPEAISTLRNMGVPSFLISSALTAIIGQRLVRTICPNCKKAFKPSAALLKSIGLPVTVTKLYRGTGCDQCYHTGNRGRTGIFEVLEITPEIRKLVVDDDSIDNIAKAAKLKTMAFRCRQKVKEGAITPEEYLRVIRI